MGAAMNPSIVLDLPYPPSVNHYWRRVGARTLISAEGRRYRKRVASALSLYSMAPMTGSVDVFINVHPPDRRRRDLDNILKALLDALEHGGVYANDSQIDVLEIVRSEIIPGGKVVVHLTELADDEQERMA